MISVCTIAARNYLAHARVLGESFLAHHPGGTFTVLLIDDEEQELRDSAGPFTYLRLSDIGLDREEVGRLAGLYDVTELATAVKPRLLNHLLNNGSAEVIYLDPDIKVYRSLEDAASLARQHGIVLTPHMLSPVPRDERWINDFQILSSGVYNLGFIAVGQKARPFIDWWWDRTRREARIEPARMMFTDQRWVDLVPSFFDHIILKDPTYNVAYWNLHERDLARVADTWCVNGAPLTFFHFSGFDARKPYLLSKHQGIQPRILLSERRAVAEICREYQEDLERAGLARLATLAYGWHALPSGCPYTLQMRRLYREALDAYELGEGPEPPNPFHPDTADRFIEWLNEPVAPRLGPTVSRYLYSIYRDRPDVQRAFPDLTGDDVKVFFDWVRRDGVAQHSIPSLLIPSAPTDNGGGRGGLSYVPASRLTEGVNIVGYFRAELGVGEAGRALTSAIEAAGIPHSTLTYDLTLSRKNHPFVERGERGAPYDINVLCINADQTPAFVRQAGPAFFEGRYTAGYWFWELDRFPGSMHAAFDHVDEVWTATSFVAGGIRAIGRRPVYTIPLPVVVPRVAPEVTRVSLGLPSAFMFLFVFDFFSVLERKNPLGLIRAFDRAFRPGEGPVLVLKTINGNRELTRLEQLRAAAAGRDDILIVDAYYSAEEKNALLGLCDSYVSLHKSEGLGLTMAEAMGLEKPVIATAYSGNLDFMTPDNSYLVDYTLGVVPRGCEPYPAGSSWAEPDLDQAAELMRRVYTARKEAAEKARTAREDILTRHNVETASVGIKRRVDEIHRGRVIMAKAARTSVSLNPKLDPHQPFGLFHAALDRASALLTPSSNVEQGRRFRGPILLVQELLFRILRPYWWQQRQLQGLMINALRELAAQTIPREALESRQQEALSALWDAVHSLERSTKQNLERLELAQSSASATTSLEQSVSAFQSSAVAHLQALTTQLASTTNQGMELSRRLYALPYMQDPERFYFTDVAGKRVLGFQNPRTSDGDAYAGFEDIFRGSETFIRHRLEEYLPILKRHAQVVEIGCGRGELLDLLRETGVPAVGVDMDEGMVRRCLAKGHRVEQIDAVSYLEAQADSSLDAIFSAQVVEHLKYEELITFLRLSRAKLKPGGQLIFETVNPHALEAFKTFWTDLSHQRPIFPEVALAWCWLLEFEQAFVFFPNGTGNLDNDRSTQGEYAVIATKAPDL